jgi:hypothetical protein
LYRDEGQEEMKKLIATLLLAFASGCVASDIRYRPCHDLGTDMSVSANEYYSQCPMRDRGTYRLNSLFSVAVTHLQGATNDELTLLLPLATMRGFSRLLSG